MKILASVLAFGLLATPAFAATRTFKDAPVIDVKCSQMYATNTDTHTRACALACEQSGYGIFTADKKFLKFDANGNAQIVKELKASTEKNHLRVNVTGDVEGSTLKVTSVKLL